MANLFNPDFQLFLKSLNAAGVAYVLVGGYSVIYHGYPRTTGDMDLFVKMDRANYNALTSAFQSFGLPLFDLTEENFISNDSIDVFSYGRAPVRIEILKKISGLSFDEVYREAIETEIDDIPIRVINLSHLISNKRKSNRHKDLDDIENLLGE
jgi:predicted nucleotidyltransferase